MRKALLIVLALLLPALIVVASGSTEGSSAAPERTFTVRLAHTHTEQGLYYKGAVRFKELVEERSGGRIIVEHFPNGQLGADRDIQEGVSLGTIEAGLSSSPVVILNDYFKLLDAPYLFVSREHVSKALDGDLGQKLAAPLAEHNIKHLGYWENGFRQITNNVRPINTPADLQGIKLRTPESPVRMSTFRTYGANPVPMPFTELFGALQQGIVDGQENPLATIYQASLQDVQKYLSLTGHVYSAVHLLMNKPLFDSMPEDLQKILVDAGREVAVYTRELGAKEDGRLADVMKEGGVQVNQADVKAFVEQSKPVWPMIVEGVKYDDAAQMMDQIAALAE
jgi:tripartite ATP-independent transporter DctP family solute receptor